MPRGLVNPLAHSSLLHPERDALHGPFAPRTLVSAALLAVAYFAGVYVGIALTFAPNPVSTLWPPNAIVLAALLLSPPRSWPLLIAAVFPAHLAAEVMLGVPLAMSLCWYVSNVTEALLGAVLVLKYVGGIPRFGHVRDVSVFLVTAVIAAAVLSSFLDAGFVALVGWRYSDYWEIWRTRLFSNSLATLTLVPLIVTWLQSGVTYFKQASPAEHLETAMLLAGVGIVSAFVFQQTHSPETSAALMYAPLPLLMWAAVRHGIGTVTLCIATVALLAIIGVLRGHGPFTTNAPEDAALAVQTFLIIAASSLLLLAASFAELRHTRSTARAERKLQELQMRKHQEQLAYLSRVSVMGELSGALAHELNQPLGAILLNAQAACYEIEKPRPNLREIAVILTEIVEDDQRAGEVIRRLRALFIHGAVQAQPVAVNSCIREVMALQRSYLEVHAVQAEARLSEQLPMVAADRVQLQQVLLNLIVNACDAMVGNEPTQRQLRIESAPASSGGIEIHICDNGHGVQDVEKIFEPFFSTKDRGIGLGLAVSRTIISAHGGRLWASRNPLRGTTFHVFLPSARE